MMTAGLSTDQAPPIWAPLRFFLTAPLMGIFASLSLILYPQSFLISHDPITIGNIHLITIGMIVMVMLGALQQMLPVLAGASIKHALNIARSTHAGIALGALLFFFGFWLDDPIVLRMASISLAFGFVTVFLALVVPLFKHALYSPTVLGMRIATLFGVLAIVLGLFLLDAYARDSFQEVHTALASWHIITAFFGFVTLLLIGVALQVLPMFYVTPSFSKIQHMFPFLFITISLLLSPIDPNALWGVMLGAFIFAVTSQQNLAKRRRPVTDTTIRYWQLSTLSLALGVLFWTVSQFVIIDNKELFLALLFGGGFVLSAIHGMLYKIVPFLIWFHLTSKGYMEVPHMRAIISEKQMQWQFYFFILTLGSLFFANFYAYAIMLAGVSFLISNTLVFINLFLAVRIYSKISKTEPISFDFTT